MQSILIVDDLESIHEMLDAVIQPIGYNTAFATDGQMALDRIHQNRYDIILTDINMKPMDGLDLLARIKEADPHAIVIMMSGYANVDNATRSLKLGAFDYLTKPFKVDQLMASIKRASAERKRRLEGAPTDGADVSSALAGESAAVKRLKDSIARLASAPTPLLLVGEKGAQKSSIASVIHERSPFASGPFVAVDAAALDTHGFAAAVLGSESHSGEKVAAASSGTLFIANVDRVELNQQSALSDLIRDLKGDTRVICGTQQDLEALVEAGQFQDGLFFRIGNGVIAVPSLRERSEDIPAIARAYFSKKGLSFQIGERASALMQAYRWPGNFGELREVLDAAAATAEGDTLHQDDLPERLRDLSNWPSLQEHLAEEGRRYKQQALRACQGDRAKAAALLGCSPEEL